MARRLWPVALLLFLAAMLLGGCGYEEQITRRESAGPIIALDDQYGKLRVTWVHEYRKPTGLSRFPDGGVPFAVAYYALVYQQGGQTERLVGRIDLRPVRRGDFGNLDNFTWQWHGSGRLSYQVKYGYSGSEAKVLEGELQIPSLP